MTDESGTEVQSEPQAPPPEAVERLKGEVAALKGQLAEAAPVLKATHLIDQLHAAFKADESFKGKDHYELAKAAAGQPEVRDAEEPAQAAVEWTNRMSSLFQANAAAVKAPPPMAGPNPAASGVPTDEGPFKVGSEEFKKFVKTHGSDAVAQAIRDGQFFFSDANRAAQDTINT